MKQSNLHFEPLTLLPKTRDFFDTQTSRAIPVFIVLIFAVFALFIVWAGYAKMDDIVKAQAVLRPVDSISSLRCLVNGEITGKYYTQNEQVNKGDILLKVDDSSEATDLENTREQLAKIKQEIEENNTLLASITAEKNMAKLESGAWIKSAAFLAECDRKKNILQQQQQELKREENMPEALRTQQKINECKANVEQSEFSFSSWKNDQITQSTDKVNSLKERVQSLESHIAALERTVKNATLYAPISGRIDEVMELNTGDYVIAGNELLRIIPDGGQKLKAEIVVDASHIARIKTGQEAKLRFPGLPPSSFGQLSSYISLIPADMTVVSNMPVFEVDAEIPKPYLVSSSGEKIHLRPGISAEARIVISRDTVLKMILRKLDFIN